MQASAASPEQKVPLTHFRGVPSFRLEVYFGASQTEFDTGLCACAAWRTTFIYLLPSGQRTPWEVPDVSPKKVGK